MDNRCKSQEDKNTHVPVTRTVSSPPQCYNSPSKISSKEQSSYLNLNTGQSSEHKQFANMSRSETCLNRDRKMLSRLPIDYTNSSFSSNLYSVSRRKREKLLSKCISLELIRTDQLEPIESDHASKINRKSKSDNHIDVWKSCFENSKFGNHQNISRKHSPINNLAVVKLETPKIKEIKANRKNSVNKPSPQERPSKPPLTRARASENLEDENEPQIIETHYPLIIQWPPPRKINRSLTNYDKRATKEKIRISVPYFEEKNSKNTNHTINGAGHGKQKASSTPFIANIIWHKSKSMEDIVGKEYSDIISESSKIKGDSLYNFKKSPIKYQKVKTSKNGESSLSSPTEDSTFESLQGVCTECTHSIVKQLKDEADLSRRFRQKTRELSESSSQESVGHRSRLDRMRDFSERNQELIVNESFTMIGKDDAACIYDAHKHQGYLDQQLTSEQEENQKQALNKWFSDNHEYAGYSDASHDEYYSESDTRPFTGHSKSLVCSNNPKFSLCLEENSEETNWYYERSSRRFEEKRVPSMYSNILSQASTDSEGREEIESDNTGTLHTKLHRAIPLTKLDHENEQCSETLMLGEYFPCPGIISRNASPGPYNIDSDSGDRSAPRSPYIPRRFSTRPLRGPYGEMLEAEMNKPKPNTQFLGEDLHLNLNEDKVNSARPTSPQSPTLMLPSEHFIAFDSPAILVSEDMMETEREEREPSASPSLDERAIQFLRPTSSKFLEGHLRNHNEMPPSSAFITESEKGTGLLSASPLHQRTASSPSNLCLEGEPEESDKDFTDYSPIRDQNDAITRSPSKMKTKRPIDQNIILKSLNGKNAQDDFTSTGNRSKVERGIKRHPSSAQQQKKPTTDADHNRALSEHRHGHRRYRDTRNHVVCELRDTEANYVRNLSFLLNKYDHPLRSSEYSTIVESSVVDAIFYQVPEIHSHHVKMLDELKKRMEAPVEENVCVGDVLLKTFKDPRVLESYSSFINNWKTAQEAAKTIAHSKPAFKHFLLAMSREHPGKRELKSLLIMPVQRFPRYELLLKRLLEHTGRDHPDFAPLKETISEVQRIANILNDIEQETLKQEQQQFILKEIEACIEGIVGLQQPDRTFIQVDQVSQHSNLGMRKERCLFLFSDLLVITSVKRRSASARKITCLQPVLLNFLESCKLKLFKFIPLDDIEIGRSREESIKRKFLRELEALEQDLQTLQQVSRLVKTLHFPKGSLEEVIGELDSSLKKQYLERQRADSHLSELELNITTPEGVEMMGFIFHKPEAKDQWEEAFNSAKQRQAQSADRRPPPEFVVSLPIRKTRAGLQFTCAAPILSHNAHNLKDVWVCNSDGYVGQVCVMSLQPEPTLASCIGVCNAKILSIASVPSAPLQSSISIQRFSYRYSSDEDDDEEISLAEDIHKNRRSESLPPDINMEESESQQPTMWLGTEDGSIIVYNCSDTIRTKRNKFKFQPGSPVHCIIHVENKVFASVANGDVIVYERDYLGSWNGGRKQIINLSTAAYPVTRMVVAAGQLWCSVANGIRIINPNTLQVEQAFTVGEEERSIACMVSAGYGVWLGLTGSATVKLIHATTFELVCEVAITSAVNKMLAGCDDIIRQHKAACLRVTSLLACKDLLWVGTSAGVIITIPLPHLTHNTRKIQNPLNMHGIPHGHTGHVRFLASVELTPDSHPSRIKGHARISFKGKDHLHQQPETVAPTKFMVISGGDGYEDFRNSSMSETAGKDDSTNHLLSWQV